MTAALTALPLQPGPINPRTRRQRAVAKTWSVTMQSTRRGAAYFATNPIDASG